MGETPVDPSILDPSYPSDGSYQNSTGDVLGDQSTSDISGIEAVAGATATGASIGSAIPGIGTAIGAGVGAVVGIFGAIESGNSQASIDQQKQQLAEEQAAELLLREKNNDALRNAQGFANMADISSENAASGHEGAGLGSQLEVKRQTDLTNAIQDQEANFQAYMIQAGASMEGEAATQASTAGYLQGASILTRGIGQVASPSSGFINYGGTQTLPSIGQGFSA